MNKNILYSTLISVFLSGLLILGYHLINAKENIVYVDSAKLLNNYNGMVDARKSYQIKATAWKSNIDTLSSEVQKQISRYEKESIRLSAKEKLLFQELIKTKQASLIDYQRAMNTQAQQEDSKMTEEVINHVNTYLKKYGISHGYKIIIAATDYGNVAYGDESIDVTDEVLAGLNKEYKAH